MQDTFEVNLRGNVGKDPQRVGQNGDVTRIVLGASRKKGQGEVTDWINVTFFNNGNARVADWAFEQIRKGMKLRVKGRLVTNAFPDSQTGQNVKTFEVHGNDFEEIAVGRRINQPQQPAQQQNYAQQPHQVPQQPAQQQNYAQQPHQVPQQPAPQQNYAQQPHQVPQQPAPQPAAGHPQPNPAPQQQNYGY